MSKNTKNYMMGVAFGFIGLMLYSLALDGFQYLEVEKILELGKSVAMPFLFTELWVAITAEGIRNLKREFESFISKLKTKDVSKKAEQA